MIRVRKDPAVPASLQNNPCTSYNGQDVQKQLLTDHDEKCYLCEQKTGKSFQIEHLKPKAEGYFPELKYEWTNLFLSCPYCNGRKPNKLKLLAPAAHNIEDIIEHQIEFSKQKIVFSKSNTDEETTDTIALLDRLHNGKNGLRDIKAQTFYKDLQQQILGFMTILTTYQSSPTDENKQAVIDSLSIEKEFLGLKYWLVKENAALLNTFIGYMVWNKQ